MSERTRRRVRVRGRVQGVWFRGATQAAAREQGVAGWVCNHRDGSVEAVLEGPLAAVEAVLDFCRTGPAGARVEAVDVVSEPQRGLTGFEILREPPLRESVTKA